MKYSLLITSLLVCPIAFAQNAQPEAVNSTQNLSTSKPKVVLEIQSAYTKEMPFYVEEKKWADSIINKTKGEVKINYLPGKTVANSSDTLDAIQLGALDGHVSLLGYFESKGPEYKLLGDMVGAMKTPRQILKFFNSQKGKALINNIHPEEITYIGGITSGYDSLIATKKVSNTAELRGLTARAPKGIVTDILSAAGVKTMHILPTEVIPSLKDKVIDAADLSTFSFNHSVKAHKTAPYPIFPGFHSLPLFEVAVSTDKWNKISPENQLKIEKSIYDFGDSLLRKHEKDNSAALRSAQSDKNISVVTWSDAALKEFFELAKAERQKIASESEKAKQVEAAIAAFMASETK